MPDDNTTVITLGRASDNTVVLDGTNVSNHHARLVLGENEIILEDLGSTNGTSVGRVEHKIVRSAVMKDDTVFLGSSLYVVSNLLSRALPDGQQPSASAGSSTSSGSGLLSLPTMLAGAGILAAVMIAVWMAINGMGSSDRQLASSDPSADVTLKSDGAPSIAKKVTAKIGTPASHGEVEAPMTLDPIGVESINVDAGDDRQPDVPSKNLSGADAFKLGELDSASAKLGDARVPESETPSQSIRPAAKPVEPESVVAAKVDLDLPNEPAAPGFRMWTVARVEGGRDLYSAKLLEHDNGTIRIQRKDESIETATVDRLEKHDIGYLRGVIWPGKEEILIQEAIELGVIDIRVNEYTDDKLTLQCSSKGAFVVPKIRIPIGSWIELSNYPSLGRIFLCPAYKGGVLTIDDWRRKEKSFFSQATLFAVPEKCVAKVPVIERVSLHYDFEKNRQTIAKLGIDPLAARIFSGSLDPLEMKKLSTKTTQVGSKNSYLCKAAALWMREDRDLGLARLQAAVESIFLRGLTSKEKAELRNLKSASGFKKRHLIAKNWDPVEDHLKIGEHLLEKAIYETQPRGEGSETEPKGTRTLTLTEALDSGVATVAGRKGLNGRVIMRLTRTDSAPAGPMHISVPIGTVLFVDDGKEEPMRLYPFYDQQIDLFGQVADGAQVPVIYGSYKRKIKTTKPLGIQAKFDPAMADLFSDRPKSDYPQMAVEAVLMDRPDLDTAQVQYHMNLTRIPETEGATVVSKELLEAAKRRIGGDKSAQVVASEPRVPDTAAKAKAVSSVPRTKPDPKTGTNDNRVERSTGSGDSLPWASVKPEERDQARLLWEDMTRFVPDNLEDDLVGTWVTVPRFEAQRLAEEMRFKHYERLSIAQGKTLSDNEVRGLKKKVQEELKDLRVLSGSIEFEIDQRGRKRYSGTLGTRKPRLSVNYAGNWHADGNGKEFSISASGNSHYHLEQLGYVAEGRLGQLGQFLGDGLTYGVVVLKKK